MRCPFHTTVKYELVGTGETCSVRKFLKLVFTYAGLHIDHYVKIDKRYFMSAEVEELIADSTRAEDGFAWRQ